MPQEVSSNGNNNLPSETVMMEDLIARDWISSPEGRKFTKQMFPQIQDWAISSPTPMGRSLNLDELFSAALL